MRQIAGLHCLGPYTEPEHGWRVDTGKQLGIVMSDHVIAPVSPQTMNKTAADARIQVALNCAPNLNTADVCVSHGFLCVQGAWSTRQHAGS